MKWIPIDSIVFTAVGYLADKDLLYLRFQNGDVYRYFAFSSEQYRTFLAAESKGRYFASNIRDKFRCDRVTPLSASANNASY